MNPNTPVIGIARVLHRMQDLDDIVEPVDLMLEAVRRAEEDASAKLLDQVRSVRVIRGNWLCFRWEDDGPYDVEIVDYH